MEVYPGMICVFLQATIPREWATGNGQPSPISPNTTLSPVLGGCYGGHGLGAYASTNLGGRGLFGATTTKDTGTRLSDSRTQNDDQVATSIHVGHRAPRRTSPLLTGQAVSKLLLQLTLLVSRHRLQVFGKHFFSF
ncbi:tail collar domain [Dyadobacter jejuensis]|uniref:Tail collar domain n=1 Tax=Dyadobacter jejuensis TaxID=1082580 RepID=A0A316ARL3_9BACT|nr:tail fiber protein [Dyadobacter jejuensis]PWJ59874.1 tail collar domain [Dyadobacter jejuensis]